MVENDYRHARDAIYYLCEWDENWGQSGKMQLKKSQNQLFHGHSETLRL